MANSAPPVAARTVAGLIAAAITAAVAMAVPALEIDEGKRNIDYLDIARVPTACFGHTGADVKVGRRRSDAECRALLDQDVRVHLGGVLRCSPELGPRPHQLAAATRLAFNIGVANWCGSTAARLFRSGNWRRGCDAFLAWNKARVNGRLVVVNGLQLRRARERAMCLADLS